MTSDLDEPHKYTFIVRFWHESGGTNKSQWRGVIVQMSSQKKRCFSSFSEMNEFIFHIMQSTVIRTDEES